MTYLGEFRQNWRFLAAASFGMAAGYSIVTYTNNLFIPHLIEQFGWTRSQLALVGTTVVLAVLCQPIAGRLTDTFGVRRMAAVGVVSAPLLFLGLSAMTGPIAQFFLLSLLLVVIVGGTTSATIYSRLIAQQFDRARGISLAIGACAPAAAGAVSVPFLSWLIDAYGWRSGYVALAAGVAVVGVLALLLIPAGSDVTRNRAAEGADRSQSYRAILRSPAFRLIIAGMLLCNIAFVLQTSQLKILLLDRGVDSDIGSVAVSLFAGGVVVGRLLCGAALDRFPAYLVATLSMGLPAVGLAMLAAGVAAPAPVLVAATLMGFGIGAEGDVMAYVVMKYFKLEVYSTVLGLVLGTIALSITLGSLLLSYTLAVGDGSYTRFLAISAVSILVGSAMFLPLRRLPAVT